MKHPVRLDDSHRYWIPGPKGEVEKPGFTHICQSLSIIKENPFWTPQGKENGTALHLYLQFIVRGGNPAPADKRIADRVEGIRKFVRDTKFKIVGGETPLYDPVNDTCCMPDLWGFIGPWAWVIDVKGGAKLPYHALQTAAQKIALNANGFRAQKRGALYLKNKSYRLDAHTDPDDMTIWKHYSRKYHSNYKEIPA